MKKILLTFFAALVISSSLSASAATDDFVSFEDTNGQVKSISAQGLSITFSDGKLIAATGSESLEIPLASLGAIYFNETNSLDVVICEDVSEATVYTSAGVQLGTYPTVDEAKANLPAGIYLIDTGSQTIKIVVK